MKKILTFALILLICIFSFFTGYCKLQPVYVYGAQDQWEDLTDEDELIDAFRAYCKSRKLFIDGSIPDAVTKFTTQTFNDICNTLGIDVTALQAELKKRYSNGIYKYLFTVNGLNGFNRIFAEFLQNYDLNVGDQVDDEVIKSGKYFLDDTGNGAFIFEFAEVFRYSGTWLVRNPYSPIVKGSPYLFDDTEISEMSFNHANYTYSSTYKSDISFSLNFHQGTNSNYPYDYYYLSNVNNVSINHHLTLAPYNNSNFNYIAFPCIVYAQNTQKLYFSNFSPSLHNNSLANSACNEISASDSSEDYQIYITTNNTTINNETTINEGDTYIIDEDGEPESDEPVPDDPDDPDPDPDDWNPVLPTVPPAGGDPSGSTTGNWPSLELPDFTLPDFSLGDLRQKFPFSIPFDVVAILQVINASPQAPWITEDIPIRIDMMNVEYTLPIDLDMRDSVYNDFAVLVRAVEFIGFCIGLIHLTIRLVKG